MTKPYATLYVNGPDTYDENNGVIFQVTDGEEVLIQLKIDGTLLLSSKIKIQIADNIETCDPTDRSGDTSGTD